MKNKLIAVVLLITSFGSRLLQASPDDARTQAYNNMAILYQSAEPNNSDTWNFYFGPTAEEAAVNSVANKKRTVMQSYFLNGIFPTPEIKRSVSWLFDNSM